MAIINSPADLVSAPSNPERTTFLTNLLNDYTTFDDAEYPEGYDRLLTAEDDGYVEPIIRKEWNSGAAAAWGFTSRQQIEVLLS